jgi:iron complex outermembrane recepter protein
VLSALSATVALCQIPRHEEVVVTGTAEPVPLEEADRSVGILTLEGRNLLANTVTDLLRLDPSVDVTARAPGGIQTDISIRGASFGQTLVLLDGLRLNDPQTGHHSMDIPVPLDLVDRLEVLRGSGSTLYGSDAVGGVVNMITRRPEASEVRVSAGAGNFGTNMERVTMAASAGHFDGQLAAVRDFSSGFRPDRDYRNLSLASTAHVRTALGSSSFLLGYSDKPFGADQFYGPYNSWEDTKTWFASVQQDLGERTRAAFSFRRHSDLFVLKRDNPSLYANHHEDETFDGSLRRRDAISTNTSLNYGVEGYNDAIASNNLGLHDRGRAATYVSLDARALRRFSVSIGAREEVWKWFRAQLCPTAAAGAWLSSKWKLRASASRAFRVPTYTELYYNDPANAGSPKLRPEDSWTFEAGTDWLPRQSVRVSAAVFERRQTNSIDYVRQTVANRWMAVNLGSLRFTGAEASVTIVPARGQQFVVSYEALTGAQGALGGLQSKYVFNYPSQSGVVTWQGGLGRGMIARTRLGAVNRLARAPYALMDIYTGYSGGRMHPFVQLTNLGNARYEEIAGVVMPGRGIAGGLEFVIKGK